MIRVSRRLLPVAVAALAGAAVVGAPFGRAEVVREPDGFRDEPYGAPTPATLRGAPALTTQRAKAMWSDRSAIFVDVLPHAPKPAGLPAGTLWVEKPHRSIAGARWLPEVGRGTVASQTEDYFKRNLADLTAGRRDHPLVIFCKRDCWMSWNAAKRAEDYGYTKVFWYAAGVEGWSEAALPFKTVEPRP